MYFVYKNKNCPVIIWDNDALLNPLADVRYQQGRLIGTMESLSVDLQKEAIVEILTLDITKCVEMENLSVDEEIVRISIASQLGIYRQKNEKIEGITKAMLDAVSNYSLPLTDKRLFFWHASLTSKKQKTQVKASKFAKIKKVVYKTIGKETTGFRATANNEISNFITWFNTENNLDSVIKAAIAHLWFVAIRPFDAGNVRIAGIITNMLLARADNTSHRFYSMLAQIKSGQKQYQLVLEETQNENFDVTDWLLWFFDCMKKALQATDIILLNILKKSEFWKNHAGTPLNNRQRFVINKLLSETDGILQSSKWAQIAKCSSDTALRDIKDLTEKGIMRKKSQGGRSTNYELVKF
ncbi:MAG: DUF4172 domain-containing protein [Prevotellaceae bacterium]|jgi:Fic family protein|nr:DUF4172 domain-containing protein [Prevotellaceae bacterium]